MASFDKIPTNNLNFYFEFFKFMILSNLVIFVVSLNCLIQEPIFFFFLLFLILPFLNQAYFAINDQNFKDSILMISPQGIGAFMTRFIVIVLLIYFISHLIFYRPHPLIIFLMETFFLIFFHVLLKFLLQFVFFTLKFFPALSLKLVHSLAIIFPNF